MIQVTMTYNRSTKEYEVNVEPAQHVFAAPGVFFFESPTQAVGVLLTNRNAGPNNVDKRRAMLETLLKHCRSDVQADFSGEAVVFHI